jgi:hypothetical protein
MKNKIQVLVAGVAVSVVFLLLAVVGFRSTLAAKPVSANEKKTNIVMNIGCELSSGRIYGVYGSLGAPAVTDTDCAQALSDLSKVGFNIDFATIDGWYGMTYTLDAPTSAWPWKHGQPMDVVLLSCFNAASGDQLVFDDGSEGAPAFASGTDCAQDLADLSRAGFTIALSAACETTQGGPNKQYTLERSRATQRMLPL